MTTVGHLVTGAAVAAARAHAPTTGAPLVFALAVLALALSMMLLRRLPRRAPQVDPLPEYDLRAARAIVERHGHDSISPFILRPDKSFRFAGGAVLAYRMIGETAVVSGDPVGPDESVSLVLGEFLAYARARRWRVALWGTSARHLERYRRLGLGALCVGEEAVVEPAGFTLEGRPVRKLRQSMHRLERRGWDILACDGRDLDAVLEREIDQVELAWRAERPRLIGFAMSMGRFEATVRPGDLYLLARSPQGRLGAVMHFISHCGKLSLDTMRRVGETPNGVNEALVCRALDIAGRRGIAEVSLNYAGLAHLLRSAPSDTTTRRLAARSIVKLLGRRFQMQRLVSFNEKFSPTWRPRYLVYESRLSLPLAVLRVLQAEGYVRQPRWSRAGGGSPALPRPLPRAHSERPGIGDAR
ncbi:MAG: bifunctional lysylphosphatidylglycerol flippase/synthetase MprF [Solirubrobacteraceae bacterium]